MLSKIYGYLHTRKLKLTQNFQYGIDTISMLCIRKLMLTQKFQYGIDTISMLCITRQQKVDCVYRFSRL